ncbi:MAG: caspase family protein [Bacteroidota bacterium]
MILIGIYSHFWCMGKRYSLHVGLNNVDWRSYKAKVPELPTCEADAYAMANICEFAGVESLELLIGELALKQSFINKMKNYAKLLKENDFLIITFSGHGTQLTDSSFDERDGKDEA